MGKQLSLFASTVEIYGIRFKNRADRYLSLLFDNVDNDFAEVGPALWVSPLKLTPTFQIREQVAHCIDVLLATQWQPGYRTCSSFLTACENDADPIQLRKAPHLLAIESIAASMTVLRGQRLPPPKVAHSQVYFPLSEPGRRADRSI